MSLFIIIHRDPSLHENRFEFIHTKQNLQGVLTVINTARVCTSLSYVQDPDPKADKKQVRIPYVVYPYRYQIFFFLNPSNPE